METLGKYDSKRCNRDTRYGPDPNQYLPSLEDRGMKHTRGAKYHPQTQGKIERYHRFMKNVINLQHYYLPGELEREIERFVEYYNNQRYHESLNNLTLADFYSGRKRECLSVRKIIKQNTMKLRRAYNLGKGGLKKQLLLVKSIH